MCGSSAPSKKHRAAHPGPEGDHQLHAGAGRHRAALHVGVVRDARGAAEALLQVVFELEAGPLPDEIGVRRLALPTSRERRHLAHPAAPDRARKPTETRSYSGWVFASLSSSSSSTEGGHRVRGLDTHPLRVISPSGSSTTAFSPVPPTSIASVRGPLSPMTSLTDEAPVASRRAATLVAGTDRVIREAGHRGAGARFVADPSPEAVSGRCPIEGHTDDGPVEEVSGETLPARSRG